MSQTIASVASEDVVVQDNKRELDQCARFGLESLPGRLGADAIDAHGNRFELKTTSKKSGGVSTARDLGPKKLDEWRGYYWLISRGSNRSDGFQASRHFFLAPQHMEGWYAKLDAGFNADIALGERVKALVGDALAEKEKERLARLLHRGMLLNDPTIPWSYIEQNGVELIGDYAGSVASLVEQFPIGGV